ncbi:MAG: right-handed parallel beta-helix repeat-containing protein, partial [Planctomycetota bacterium]
MRSALKLCLILLFALTLSATQMGGCSSGGSPGSPPPGPSGGGGGGGGGGGDPPPKAGPWDRGEYYPVWKDATVLRELYFPADFQHLLPQDPDADDYFTALQTAINGLIPGDKLIIEREILQPAYDFKTPLIINCKGTQSMPIRIEARAPFRGLNTDQDIIHVGEGPGNDAQFLHLRGFSLSGGQHQIKLYVCHNVWIDGCSLRSGGGWAICATGGSSSFLFVTDNSIYRPGEQFDTPRGIVFGTLLGKDIVTDSVIYHNNIRSWDDMDPMRFVGQGIEVHENSVRNWIVKNNVHHFEGPCVQVYGCGGAGINIIEKNTLRYTLDYTLWVHAEAICRNNLILNLMDLPPWEPGG